MLGIAWGSVKLLILQNKPQGNKIIVLGAWTYWNFGNYNETANTDSLEGMLLFSKDKDDHAWEDLLQIATAIILEFWVFFACSELYFDWKAHIVLRLRFHRPKVYSLCVTDAL